MQLSGIIGIQRLDFLLLETSSLSLQIYIWVVSALHIMETLPMPFISVEKMVKEGAIFQTTSDTETVVQLIAKSRRTKIIDKIIDAIFQIQGGYAMVMLTNKKLIGIRDPYGIRPLVLGKLGRFLYFCI